MRVHARAVEGIPATSSRYHPGAPLAMGVNGLPNALAASCHIRFPRIESLLPDAAHFRSCTRSRLPPRELARLFAE